LTDQEKIKALLMESHDKRIFEIAKELEKPQSTIRSFIKTYKSRGTLKPPQKDHRIMINLDVNLTFSEICYRGERLKSEFTIL
jgi:hypothetical protein